jgi:hypothetical protein
MRYKDISFSVKTPVTVDWGDGNAVSYPAGVVTGTPVGEVIVTSSEPLEEIEFLTDTISQAKFESAKSLKYANEMFKDKSNIQVVYFDTSSPIETFRKAFYNSGIIYHSGAGYTKPKQLQYMHKHARRLQCIENLDTTNAFNAYGLFEHTPNLRHPTTDEIARLENTDAGGCHFDNTYQCIYQVFQNKFKYDTTLFPDIATAPSDYVMYFPFKSNLYPQGRAYAVEIYGDTHIGNDESAIFDTSYDFVFTEYTLPRDSGSIVCWVKKYTASTAYGVIVGEYNTSSNTLFWIDNNTKHIKFRLGTQKGELDGGVIPYDEWVFVAATYTPTTDSLYIDGVLVDSTDNVAMTGEFFRRNGVHMTIGGIAGNTSLAGEIKQLYIFDRALHPLEVAAIYSKGL